MIGLEEMIEKSKEIVQKSKKDSTKKRTVVPPLKGAEGETLAIFEALNFIVNRRETPKQDEYGAKQYYYCQYKEWIFLIREIEQGPLYLYDPRNVKTGEKISFYCDLRCTETSKERLKEILKVMDTGLERYMQAEYGHFMELPTMLKNRGYAIEEHNFKFGIHEHNGYLKVDKSCYIRIYRNEKDKIEFVVTNNPDWNMNFQNGHWEDKAYYFSYKRKSDIDELCCCIEAFIKEQRGDFGFYEEGRCYKNEDIESYLQYLQKMISVRRFDVLLNEDKYKKEGVNLYEGKEIFKRFDLRFCVDSYEETYTITFEYNKEKDENHCILSIESYLTKENKPLYTNDCCELRGSFSTLYQKMKTFLIGLLEVHEMKI